jgi:hypothetical protein
MHDAAPPSLPVKLVAGLGAIWLLSSVAASTSAYSAFQEPPANPIIQKYKIAKTEAERASLRNEHVAKQMYAIDIQYTAYERALADKRPRPRADIARRGFFDADVLRARTIQEARRVMRERRQAVTTRIAARLRESTAAYPLSAALHDLEDYYRAGTLADGLIKATGTKKPGG